MSFLQWISDTDLKNEVTQLLSKAKSAKKTAIDEFGKNVIDPFAALFEMSGFEIDFDTWLKSETTRQAFTKVIQLIMSLLYQRKETGLINHLPRQTKIKGRNAL